MHRLTVLYPEQDRQEKEIPHDGLVIGRSKSCDIRLGDEFISAEHCKVYFESGYFFIEDLNSTNGTFIDGAQIERKAIFEPGQNIQIGVSVMKVG